MVGRDDYFELEATGPEAWHSAEYTAYLQSPQWRDMHARIMRRSGGTCETCGAPATQVHHLTYERVGHEDPADLVAVCHRCHERHDAAYRERIVQEKAQRRLAYARQEAEYARQRQRWEEEARQRAEARKWAVELNRWATKRYGSSWELWSDRGAVEREFSAWVERMRVTHKQIREVDGEWKRSE